MRRIYHPYTKWEEIKFNMWGTVSDKNLFLKKAIDFTGNHELYGSWMSKVIKDWKYSCENNLTDTTQNRKAWLGHAAVAYAIQCPENIVREAWGMLSQEQKDLANNEAEKAIIQWENERKNNELCSGMGTALLFDWYTTIN